MSTKPSIGYWTAASTVVANIVGTGVFTSLGFQLLGITDPAALLLLWAFGGVIAMAGALAYSEIAAAIPRSGGERTYLAELWHPLAGSTAGWVSVTVGFSAPIALAAMALGRFTHVAVGLPARATAMIVVVLIAALHGLAPAAGRRVQVGATGVKLLLIIAFIALAVSGGDRTQVSFALSDATLPAVLSSAFAVSLIYVGYAYTGWNAAVYFSAEVVDSRRTVPRVLAGGTLTVALLYVLLHWAFLRVAPMDAMVGRVEIGAIAAEAMLGQVGGRIMSGALALLLLSTISAMCLAGPRALEATLNDLPALGRMVARSSNGRPIRAVALQAGLALAFVATDAFETTLTFSGAILTLCSMATVAGVYRLRAGRTAAQSPNGTSVTAHLAPPIYLTASAWTLVHVVRERPVASVAAFGVVLALGLLSLFLRSLETQTT